MFDVDYEALAKGLELMGYGMLGIFIVLFLLYLISVLLIRFFPFKNSNQVQKNKNRD